jgi:hypothetical protein
MGYNFILRLVDPVHRYGFAMVLHNIGAAELRTGLGRVLSLTRVQPHTIYYNSKTSFVCDISNEHESIELIESNHSSLMKIECSLYKKQLHKWIDAYNNNWVRGAVLVQAVVNAIPVEQPL